MVDSKYLFHEAGSTALLNNYVILITVKIPFSSSIYWLVKEWGLVVSNCFPEHAADLLNKDAELTTISYQSQSMQAGMKYTMSD